VKKAIYFSKMIPFAVKNANAIIAVSKSSADDIEKSLVKKDKYFCCTLGVDEDRFFPYKSTKRQTIEKDIELLANRGIWRLYWFLGLLEPRKSVPTLIGAFGKIAENFPNSN
jgi:glycosyltransferase involved in cell wall biosynthesis